MSSATVIIGHLTPKLPNIHATKHSLKTDEQCVVHSRLKFVVFREHFIA